MNESSENSTTSLSPIQIKFQPFISPINKDSYSQSTPPPSSPTTKGGATAASNEQLIIYAAPVIQMQLSSRCKETIDRLKQIKKEKSLLLAIINPQTNKIPLKQRDNQQQQE